MTPSEEYLKNFLCSHCHVALLYIHPEQKFANQNFYKCILCGFTKQIIKEISPVNKIIYGR